MNDREYLEDCIQKATPNLSKIKDVHSTLNEIRGIEQASQKDMSAEEILRNKFNNNFLDLDYVDLCVEAMEEYSGQCQKNSCLKCALFKQKPEPVKEVKTPEEYADQKQRQEDNLIFQYIKSEYDHQLPRMTKILGKKPIVFEQGVNALLYLLEQRQEISDEEVRSAEEMLDRAFEETGLDLSWSQRPLVLNVIKRYASQVRNERDDEFTSPLKKYHNYRKEKGRE